MEEVRAERELAGRVALVTGAGSGIGRGAAAALGAAGADVVLVGRRRKALEGTLERLRAKGVRARSIALDVADSGAADRLLREAGPADVLVHAAAAFPPYAPLERVEAEAVDAAVGSILGGALQLARAFLPAMKERGHGRLIFVGSVAARAGAPGQAAYAAAKAGLVGLARTLAAEVGHRGVTANVLELGLIDTERTRAAIADDVFARIAESTAAGRAGRVEEVAAAVRFLASPAAAYVNGAVLTVDGGLGLGLARPDEGRSGGERR